MLLLGATLLVGVLLYIGVSRFVANSQLPIFPSVASAGSELPGLPHVYQAEIAALGEQGELVVAAQATITQVPLVVPDAGEQAEGEALPPPATEPMTILVMGIDRREAENDEDGPWRTDSMILLTIDPESNAIAMLSFPRDMLITLPDYGWGERQDRINTAFYYGDYYDYPGGGPASAMQAIKRNFGIEVDRYLVMDFDGFRKVIDYIGGVDIYVPELLVDTQYPTEDYGYQTVRFERGWQHMDGETALQYARTRKSTSDFARAERHQEVVLALRNQVLSRNIIASLTPSNLGRLAVTLNRSIQTDITVNEVLSLAQVARNIEDGNIRRALIDNTMVRTYYTEAGAEVLIADWVEVAELVRETFGGLVAISSVRGQTALPPPLPTATRVPPTWTPRPRATSVPTWTPEPEEIRVTATPAETEATEVPPVEPTSPAQPTQPAAPPTQPPAEPTPEPAAPTATPEAAQGLAPVATAESP